MFYLSKILSAITQPMFWLAIWWFAALLIISKWRRAALRMLWSGLLVLFLLGFEAFPNMLLRPLENRYPVPQTQEISSHVGFIVLGGATGHPNSFLEHGQVPLGGAAERMTVPVAGKMTGFTSHAFYKGYCGLFCGYTLIKTPHRTHGF